MIFRTATILACAFIMAACTGGSQPQPQAQPTPEPAVAPQPAPPDVGFSPDVSDAAVSACRNALDAQTEGALEVTGTEYSEANSAVYMVIGPQRAPWRCLIDAAGKGEPDLMFIGDEGAL